MDHVFPRIKRGEIWGAVQNNAMCHRNNVEIRVSLIGQKHVGSTQAPTVNAARFHPVFPRFHLTHRVAGLITRVARD